MTDDTTPTRFGPVSGDDMAEWCAWLRDDNAIHLRREAAEAAGFGPRRVNPGPANLAYVLGDAMADRPEAEFDEITALFTGNVFEDDLLAIRRGHDGRDCWADLVARGREAPVLRVRFSFREDD